MSIIASSMFYKTKSRAVMASIACAMTDICNRKNLEYQRKYAIASGGTMNAVTLGNLLIVSVDDMLAVSNAPLSQSIIDIVGRFFDKDAYTTNAKDAIDSAEIILAGSARAISRLDIDTSRFKPESDVLIKRITLDMLNGDVMQVSVKMSVFDHDFETEVGTSIADMKKRLSAILNAEDDEE